MAALVQPEFPPSVLPADAFRHAVDQSDLAISITDTEAWKIFLNVGTLFNYVARIFSAGSSIVNNVNVIVTTIQTLNKFKLTGTN